MNVEDILLDILEGFGLPVIRQGSMLDDEAYPDTFFTFWGSDSVSDRYFDNAERCYTYDYEVNVYSIDPAAVYLYLRRAIAALKAAGFIISGDGHDVASDEKTHDGRGISAQYVKKLD